MDALFNISTSLNCFYLWIFGFSHLSWTSSPSFLSICSLNTLLAFSRHNTLSLSWFSLTRRASLDFLAARLFFLKQKIKTETTKFGLPSSLPIFIIFPAPILPQGLARVPAQHVGGCGHVAVVCLGLGQYWVKCGTWVATHVVIPLAVGT